MLHSPSFCYVYNVETRPNTFLCNQMQLALQGEVTNPGVVPRAIQDVFDIIEKTPDRDFLLRMSMMEIYNEVGASLTFQISS